MELKFKRTYGDCQNKLALQTRQKSLQGDLPLALNNEPLNRPARKEHTKLAEQALKLLAGSVGTSVPSYHSRAASPETHNRWPQSPTVLDWGGVCEQLSQLS